MINTKTKQRVAVYIRTSTDWQRKGVDVQKADILEYCDENGYSVEENAIYVDTNKSGSLGKTERPALERLLGDVAKNKFDTLVVYRLDRLSREFPKLVGITQELAEHGTRVVSVSEPFDTNTQSTQHFIQSLMILGRNERQIKELTGDKEYE